VPTWAPGVLCFGTVLSVHNSVSLFHSIPLNCRDIDWNMLHCCKLADGHIHTASTARCCSGANDVQPTMLLCVEVGRLTYTFSLIPTSMKTRYILLEFDGVVVRCVRLGFERSRVRFPGGAKK